MAEETLDIDLETADFVDEETEYDLAFPTLPLEDDPSPPEELGEELVDDLDDFAEDADDDVDEDPDDGSGDDWAMDWETEEFLVDSNGQPLRVSGDTAVVEWVFKALNTPRGVYPIYSENYGSELHLILGAALPGAVLNAEITRTVLACVTQHPRIDDAEILEMDTSSGSLSMVLALTLDDEEEPVVMEVFA